MRSILTLIIVLSAASVSAQGLHFDDVIYRNAQKKPHLMRGDGDILPIRASLKEYCPPPGNQLDYATSVGWAVGWAGKTILFARNNNLTGKDIIPHIFAPTYIYQLSLQEGDDCFSGITLEEGLKALKDFG